MWLLPPKPVWIQSLLFLAFVEFSEGLLPQTKSSPSKQNLTWSYFWLEDHNWASEKFHASTVACSYGERWSSWLHFNLKEVTSQAGCPSCLEGFPAGRQPLRASTPGGEDALYVCSAGTGLYGPCCSILLLYTMRYPPSGSQEPSEFQFFPAQLKIYWLCL